MRTTTKGRTGWYRSSAWTRYWFFSAGAVLLFATFAGLIYFTPHTLATRLAFGAAFAVSYGIMSMSYLIKSN